MNSIKRILDARQRRQLILVLIGMMIAAGFEMIGIGAIPAFVAVLTQPDRMLSTFPLLRNWDALNSVDRGTFILFAAAALAAVFIIKNLFLTGLLYAQGVVFSNATMSISNRLFRAYVYSPFTFHLQRNPAQLVNNVDHEVSLAVELIAKVALIIREGLVLLLVFVLLLIVDPLVSLSVFALLGAVAGAFYVVVRRSLTERGHLAQGFRIRRLQSLTQAFGAIKDAKILGREPDALNTFALQTASMERQHLFERSVSGLPRLFLEVLAVICIVLVAVVFQLLGRPTEALLPVLALLAVAVVRLIPAFNAIAACLVGIRYVRPSLDLVAHELQTLEPAADLAASRQPGEGPLFSRVLEVENLHYRFPGTAADTINGITVAIHAGQTVGFIGPSGGGKSTLIDVVLGLLTPTAGTVSIDGVDLQSNLTAWQRQIGYIQQDIYLIDDTIRRNVAFGLPDDEIDEQAVTRALAAAQLETFVSTLPAGLDTTVGNRGIRLSGGQRQRLGIARALYHDPAVLIMDEATSALDHHTERELVDGIMQLRGHRTVIVVAHRLSTVRDCHQLHVIEAGRITDSGTYAELAARHKHLEWPRRTETEDYSMPLTPSLA